MSTQKASNTPHNEEQLQGIVNTDGPTIIIAGAGTGKTSVVTARIAYIIEKNLATPSEILALTFTEKACEEMQNRLDVTLPYGQSDVDVYTFHSFGDSFLRENAIALGITSEYKIMNRAEEIYFFKENLFKFHLDYYRPLSNPAKFIESILTYFSKLHDEDIDPSVYKTFLDGLEAQLEHNDLGRFSSHEELSEYLAIHTELYETQKIYESLKKEKGLLTFADLITLPLQALREKSTIRSYYQNKYKYILVDEFQDTNYTQNEMVTILSQKHKNLCVCGDDDQSIYKFRGASISNILQFEEIYPGCKKIVLTKNYRSTQPILDEAYKLITYNNPNRLEIVSGIDKKLVAASNIQQDPVITQDFPTLLDEMQYITKTIKEELAKNPSLRFNDFAVLVRSNSQVPPLIRECNNAEIPFSYQGNTGLYETEEIRPLLSFLYALARFDDTINYFHLASSAFYNVSMQTLIACNNLARLQNKHLSYIFRNIAQFSDELEISEEDIKKLQTLNTDIDTFQELSRDQSVGSVLLAYIKEKNYLESVSENEQLKIDHVQKFFQKIDRFITNTSFSTIQQFCDYLDYTREMGDDPSVDDVSPESDAINILTIHRAKGMEFSHVFMIDLVEGRFPSRAMRDPIEIPEELVKEIIPKGDFHKQEERRLFYVGMTRAKNQLYLLWAKDYYLKTAKRVSPFVLEASGKTEDEKPKREKIIRQEEIKKELKKKSQLTLSPSQIEEYLTCPLKYEYLYNIGLKAPYSFSLFYGSLMHSLVQQILMSFKQKNVLHEADLYTLIEEKWNERGFLSEEHSDVSQKRAKEICIKFLKDVPSLKPHSIEKSFSLPFDDYITIIGRWDLITKDLHIVDFKTSVIRSEKEAIQRAKDSIQLKIYAWAYEKQFHELPGFVELYFLDSGIRGGYIPTTKTLKDVEKIIQTVGDGIMQGNFAAAPSFMACTFCQYNKICPFTLAN